MLAVVNKRLRHANQELVVLYEVSRIIAEEINGLPALAIAIIAQLRQIVTGEKALFIVIDPTLKMEKVVAEYGHGAGSADYKKTIPEYDAMKTLLLPRDMHYKVQGKNLFLAVKNFDGELNGLIILCNQGGEFDYDGIRLCVSVAEQLGHVIESMMKKESEKDEDKLNTNFISF